MERAKGPSGLDKVVLREARGFSAEVINKPARSRAPLPFGASFPVRFEAHLRRSGLGFKACACVQLLLRGEGGGDWEFLLQMSGLCDLADE